MTANEANNQACDANTTPSSPPNNSESQFGNAIKQTFSATKEQMARIWNYWASRWRVNQSKRSVDEAMLQLGEAAFRVGIGDCQLRSQINNLDAQLAQAESDRKPRMKLKDDRIQVIRELAKNTQTQAKPDSPLGEVLKAVERANQEVKEAEHQAVQLRANLFPHDQRERRFVLYGIGTLAGGMLVIVLMTMQNANTLDHPTRGFDKSSYQPSVPYSTATADRFSTTQLAGQFLIDPNEFLGWFSVAGIAAVALMLGTLIKLRDRYLLRLGPDITNDRFGLGLGIGGVLSVVLTLILHASSSAFVGKVQEVTGYSLDPARVDVAKIKTSLSDTGHYSGYAKGVGIALKEASKNKTTLAIIVGVILLLAVGAGHAFLLFPLPFWWSFAAWSAGVGLPEEFCKACAGLLVLYLVFDTKAMSPIQFKRATLAAFAIAGLGFGAVEALKYFGMYTSGNCDLDGYAIRATWCVTLHGAWTLLVGALVMSELPQLPELLATKKAELFLLLVVASIPTVIAHGLYDALCGSGNALPYVVGGVSIYVAWKVIWKFVEDHHDIAVEEPVQS